MKKEVHTTLFHYLIHTFYTFINKVNIVFKKFLHMFYLCFRDLHLEIWIKKGKTVKLLKKLVDMCFVLFFIWQVSSMTDFGLFHLVLDCLVY